MTPPRRLAHLLLELQPASTLLLACLVCDSLLIQFKEGRLCTRKKKNRPKAAGSQTAPSLLAAPRNAVPPPRIARQKRPHGKAAASKLACHGDREHQPECSGPAHGCSTHRGGLSVHAPNARSGQRCGPCADCRQPAPPRKATTSPPQPPPAPQPPPHTHTHTHTVI